jgi:hypothetical protein
MSFLHAEQINFMIPDRTDYEWSSVVPVMNAVSGVGVTDIVGHDIDVPGLTVQVYGTDTKQEADNAHTIDELQFTNDE